MLDWTEVVGWCITPPEPPVCPFFTTPFMPFFFGISLRGTTVALLTLPDPLDCRPTFPPWICGLPLLRPAATAAWPAADEVDGRGVADLMRGMHFGPVLIA